jgi:hypothetical protein
MALGFLAGPSAWIIYFMAGYLLIEAACKSAAFGFALMGLSGVSAIIFGLTIVSLLIVCFAGWWTYHRWRAHRAERPNSESGGPFEGSGWLAEGHIRFMTFVGLLLNGLFATVILITGLAVFFLQPC